VPAPAGRADPDERTEVTVPDSTEPASNEQDLLLPEGSCLLHIGPYKTGSTAVQVAMHKARGAMRERGVVYPGTWQRAMRPGWAVLGYTPRGRDPVPIEVWQDLVAEVRDPAAIRSCVSTEDFGSASPARAKRIVDDLGGDSVHVVAVARRLDRLLPSQWQERVKSHDTFTYDAWLRLVLGKDREDREWRRFWASHDVGGMFDRWAPASGPDRFTLVVPEPSGLDLVPRTFERMLGLPEGLLQPPAATNASLSANGTELVRRLNEVFAAEGWPDTTYHRLVQRGVTLRMIEAPRAPGEAPIPPLPAWAAERAAELSERRVRQVQERGMRVVGDLAHLLMEPSAAATVPAPGEEAEEARAPEVISLTTAVNAVAGVVEGAEKELSAARRRRRRTPVVEKALDKALDKAGGAPGRGNRLVEEIPAAELVRVVAGRVLRRAVALGRRGRVAG
jgi:hypothetical protein